jgi:3',5'-nucleoside bisphosphate phosphatase
MHPIHAAPVKPFQADLHCHSSCSDGSLDPQKLIDLAVAAGLQGLSITDHDTLDAYSTAASYAKKKGILLGTGVELSCDYKKKNVHVLAYDFSLENQELHDYCKRQQNKRQARNRMILEKLSRLQIIVTEEELLAKYQDVSALGRPHIATIMMQKGYVGSIQEAFDRYIGDQRCCFIAGESFPVQEAIAVIREAGGKAFLAHPHLYANSAFVREILSLGFDGVECFYGRFSYLQEKLWLKLAEDLGILVSGGSDFHGESKPQVPLGCSFVDHDRFNAIFNRNLLG